MAKHNAAREARRAAGLRQVDLASRAGVCVATVQTAERVGAYLSPATAARVAPVLGIDPAALLVGGRR
jgi:transcriptional regulator with XRE-family HTH domain